MKKKPTLFWGKLLLFCLFSFQSYFSLAQNTAHKILAANMDSVAFLQYVPPGHNSPGNTRTYPLIIFLHGGGEKSDNNSTAPGSPLWKLEGSSAPNDPGFGPSRLVRLGSKLAFSWNGKVDSFMAISPLSRFTHRAGTYAGTQLGYQWLSHEYVTSVINYAKTNLKVDTNRIFLTGLSLGGGGTFRYLSQNANNGKLLAGAAPVCAVDWDDAGVNLGWLSNNVYNAKLPVWAFHASNDATTGYIKGTVNTVDTINNHVPPPLTPAIKTIWPTGGHFIWDRVYNIDNPAYAHGYDGIINIYEWFLGQNNDSVTANILPTALGKDTTIAPSPGTANLDASASTDVNGRIAKYVWKKLTAPAGVSLSTITITKPWDTLSSTTVSGLTTLGNYTFELIVVDNRTGMDRDTVTITVDNVPPPGGKAVSINATGGRIIAGNLTQLKNATAFTVEAYFKFDTTVTDWSNTEATVFRHYVSGTDMIKLNVFKPNKAIHFTIANGLNAKGYTANNVVSHDTWYHIAAVFEGAGSMNADRAKVYINGVLQPLTFTDSIPTVTSGSTPSVIFGGEPSASKVTVIDEVRFWDSVVAPSTIASWKDRLLGSCHPNIGHLKLYWPLNSDATPTHALAGLGTSYTSPIFSGSYVSSSLTFDTVSCPAGKAVSFNATTGARIIAGNVTQIKNATAFTVEAHFKYDSTVTDWSNTEATIFRNYITSTDMIKLNVYKPNRAIHFTIANGLNAKGYTVNNVVSHDTWYHVAAVFEGAGATNAHRAKIYINGVLQPLTFTDSIPTAISGSTPVCLFGGEPSASRLIAIDEVRIWDSVLSQSTIELWKDKQLSNCHPNKNRLKLYWPLNSDATPTHALAGLGTSYTSPIFYGTYIASNQASITATCGSPALLSDYTEPLLPSQLSASKAYPNPTPGAVQLEFQATSAKHVWVTAVDMYGKYVFSKQMPAINGKNTLPINIASLRAGNYFITIRQGTNTLGKYKVVKR